MAHNGVSSSERRVRSDDPGRTRVDVDLAEDGEHDSVELERKGQLDLRGEEKAIGTHRSTRGRLEERARNSQSNSSSIVEGVSVDSSRDPTECLPNQTTSALNPIDHSATTLTRLLQLFATASSKVDW